MSDPVSFWIFLVLLSGAVAVIWLLTAHVARRDEDLAADERAIEAGWIAETIERWGGDVPLPVVEQVLDLHRRYLEGPPPELPAEPAAPSSAGDDTPMQRHDAGREAPEADVGQVG